MKRRLQHARRVLMSTAHVIASAAGLAAKTLIAGPPPEREPPSPWTAVGPPVAPHCRSVRLPADPDTSPRALRGVLLETSEKMLEVLERAPHDFDLWTTYVAQQRLKLAVRAARGERLSTMELGQMYGLVSFKKSKEAVDAAS